MAEGEYQVVFRGELTGDHPAETVKQQLADLFGMSTGRIDALFSGKPVVVKKHVDRQTAERFDQTFRKAGAVCEIRGPEGMAPGRGDDAATASGNAAADPGASSNESTQDTAAPANEPPGRPADDTATAAGSTAAAGDPNGTVVALDIPDSFEGLEIDDSGGPLAQAQPPDPPEIDTGDLSLAPDDERLLDTREPPPPADIDTSGLSIEALEDPAAGEEHRT